MEIANAYAILTLRQPCAAKQRSCRPAAT